MTPDCIPQNDMDCYYNGKWKRHIYMANKQSVNNFTIIQDQNDIELFQYVADADVDAKAEVDNAETAKMIQLRDSYDNRNTNLSAIQELIAATAKINTIADLSAVIYEQIISNISTLFTLTINPHPQSDIYVLAVGTDPLDASMIDKTFRKHVTTICDFIQHKLFPVGDDFVAHIVIFELLLSKVSLDRIAMADPSTIHNVMTVEEFICTFDTANFWKLLLAHFSTSQYILYDNAEFFELLDRLLCHEGSMPMIRDYMIFHIVAHFAPYLPVNQPYHKLGLVETVDPKKTCISMFYSTFGPHLQRIYEANHSANASTCSQVRTMFNNIRNYCVHNLERSSLFSQETNQAAIQKLLNIELVLGVADVDVLVLPELTNDFYRNMIVIDQFYSRSRLRLLSQPLRRLKISLFNDIFSFMVNAFYDQRSNLIYIPTTVLIDKIFFDPNASPAHNYGSLGAIIGHEMIHCLDNYGCQFDYNGHLVNWWSDSDYALYKTQQELVLSYYAKYIAARYAKSGLDAEFSLSENIADIGGIKVSLRTFITLYRPNRSEVKEFFASWVKTLRAVETDKSDDVHLPNAIRTNAPFSHIAEYYDVFNVKPIHQNYLAKELRTIFMD